MLVAPPARAALRTMMFPDPNVALAISVRLTMGHPAFAGLPFGPWAGVLAAQAARGHTRFFVDPHDVVVGFFGFALTDRAGAEAWAFRNVDLPDAACRGGDCVVFNAWVATSATVNAAMVDEVRRMGVAAAYYRRFYLGGRIRAVRLPVTDPRFPTRSVPRRANPTPGAESLG